MAPQIVGLAMVQPLSPLPMGRGKIQQHPALSKIQNKSSPFQLIHIYNREDPEIYA